MADDAKLKIQLQAQTASFEKKLKKAEERMQRMARGAKKSTGSMGKDFSVMGVQINAGLLKAAAGFASFGAAVAAAKKTLDFIREGVGTADQLIKLSKSIGVASQDMQKLRYAAEIGGANMQNFDRAMQKFTGSIGEAHDGLSTQIRAFETMGVSIYDANGQLKNNIDLLYESMDALRGIENHSVRAAAARAVFGRAGVQLLNFLTEGSASAKALGRELEDAGAVMGGEFFDAAEKTADEILLFNKRSEKMKTEAAVMMAPMLIEWEKLKLAIVSASFELADFWNLLESPKSKLRDLEAAVVDLQSLRHFEANNPATPRWAKALFGDEENSNADVIRATISAREQKIRDLLSRLPPGMVSPELQAQIDAIPGIKQGTPYLPIETSTKKSGVFKPETPNHRMDKGRPLDVMDAADAARDSKKILDAAFLREANKYAHHSDTGRPMDLTDAADAVDEANKIFADAEKERHNQRMAILLDQQNAFMETAELARQSAEDAKDSWRSTADTISSSLQGLATGALTLEQAFNNVLQSILQKAVYDPFADMAAGWLGSTFGALGSAGAANPAKFGFVDSGGFIGAPAPRAGGGAVVAGRGYMVGEHGREAFVPRMAGNIVPHKALTGGKTIVVNQHFAASVPPDDARRAARMAQRAMSAA